MKCHSVLVGLFLVVTFCLASCGGAINNNSKIGEQSDNNNSKIDELQASHKQWERDSNGNLTLCSDNYYITDRGENLYGMIHFMETDEGKLSGLSFFVTSDDEKQPRTSISFDKEKPYCIVSFNGGDYVTWPYFAPPRETAMIGYYDEWEKNIRESETCEIRFNTELGQMDFKFNTKGFIW